MNFRGIRLEKKISGVRWLVLFMLFFGTIICYIDRLTVSYLAPVIQEELGISNLQYAGITTWFLLTYSIFQLFAGRLYDWIGTKRAYSASITIWSLAAIMHAFSRGVIGLSIFRGILGVGEAGHWPGVIKTIAEWFPAKGRAIAMGLVNSGASIGSVIAPPLIVWLLLAFGWRAAFIATGSLGFIWLIFWLIIYFSPKNHPWISSSEQDFILDEASETDTEVIKISAESPEAEHLRAKINIYRTRQAWGISIARFFGDPIWWLYLIWLPLYLKNARGFSMEEIGNLAWLPFLFAAIGGITGGWFSGYLIKRGLSVHRARMIAIIVGTLFLPCGLLVITAGTPQLMWIFICLTLFGFQFWVGNVQTLPSDIFEKRYVGSVAGMSQAAAGVGAMIFVLSTGWVVDHFSYTPILVAAGFLGPLATISLLICGKIKKIYH